MLVKTVVSLKTTKRPIDIVFKIILSSKEFSEWYKELYHVHDFHVVAHQEIANHKFQGMWKNVPKT